MGNSTVIIICIIHLYSNTTFAIVTDILTNFDESSNCTCNESDVVFSLSSESILRCGLYCDVNNRCDRFLYNGQDESCLGCQGLHETGPMQGAELGNKCYIEEWLIFEEFKYKLSTSKMSYTDGVAHCRSIGGYIAKLNNEDKNEFIRDKARRKNMSVWIGLTDKGQEGVWIWESDGEPANFTNWHNTDSHTEPNGGEASNCVYLARGYSYHWADLACNVKLSVLCEKRLEKKKI